MAANGVGVPTQIQLSGTGVTQVKGNVYAVTLSLSGTTSVAVTAAAKDVAGSDPSVTGQFTTISYNAGTGSSDPARVATVASASANPFTVNAVHVGHAVIETQYPFADVDGLNPLNEGKVYAQLQVTVTL